MRGGKIQFVGAGRKTIGSHLIRKRLSGVHVHHQVPMGHKNFNSIWVLAGAGGEIECTKTTTCK